MSGILLRAETPETNFHNLKFDPIILNQLPVQTVADREAFQRLLITEYGKDVDGLETVASCRCGEHTNEIYVGKTCDVCGTKVVSTRTLSPDSMAWIECPPEAVAFFTPLAWNMFSNVFSAKKAEWNGMAYLCKTTYKSAPENVEVARRLQARLDTLGFRGLDKVMQNLDVFLEFVIAESRKAWMPEFIAKYRDQLTTQYLPMPTKTAFVLEKTALGDYTDSSLKGAMEAIQHIIALQSETKPAMIVNRCVSIMEELRSYYDKVFSVIGKKPQWFRKAVYGARLNFAWRTVITSRYGIHHYEEIEIPYSQACVLFKVHLYNRLTKRHGMSERAALEYISRHTAHIDPFLLNELNSLVAETPGGKGFWSTLTRYPTLGRASTQLLRIVGFTQSSTTISPLVLVGPNADFDGDNMTGVVLLSNEQVKAFEHARPLYSIFNNSQPGTLNNNTKLPDAPVSTWHAYTEEESYMFDRWAA